jgi:predicted RND superfamily exporter protein
MDTFKDYFPNEDLGIVVLQGEKHKILQVMPKLKADLLKKSSVEGVLYHVDFSELEQKKILYGPLGDEGLYMSNKDETLFLMMVTPKLSSENFMDDRKNFYDDVYEVIGKYDMDIGLTGGALIQDYEADTVAFEDMGWKVFITLILVLVFIVLMFKSIKIPFLAMIPLTFGIVTTGAIAYLVYGQLNMFSATFVMLLIGLGIDFSVHLLMAITTKAAGEANEIMDVISHTSKGIMMGAITTSAAFLAFLLADFKAFEQMGFISGLGILILACFTIVILSALIFSFDFKFSKNIRPINLSLDRLVKYKRGYFISLIIICMILLPSILDFQVVGDMNKIYPNDMPSKVYEKLLIDVMDYDVNKLTVLIDKRNSQEIIQALNEVPTIKNIESIYDYLPPDQEETLRVLKNENIILSPIERDDLPDSIKNQFISKDKMRLEITPDFNIYDTDKYRILSNQIELITGNYPVGMAALMNEVIILTQKDIIKISVFCILFIFIALRLMLKKSLLTLMTLLPVLITLYMTIALLPLLGKDINIFSIASFPLILGIGIDSGIHLIQSLILGKEIYIQSTLKALFITTVTTVIGFSSLTMINHPGMSNLGFSVAFGMTINFIITLILLPSLYVVLLKSKKHLLE